MDTFLPSRRSPQDQGRCPYRCRHQSGSRCRRLPAGRFRQDLFHRLGQLQLRVPPLRERPEDIVALAEHFLNLKKPGSSYTPEAVSVLLSHTWPGNVRELRKPRRQSCGRVHSSRDPKGSDYRRDVRQPDRAPPIRIHAGRQFDSMEEQMIIRALERSGAIAGKPPNSWVSPAARSVVN